MASIIRINTRWRAQVRRKGYEPVCQTFSSRKLAQIWAAKVEAEIEAKRAGLIAHRGKTGELLSVIFDRASEDSKCGRTKLNVVKHLTSGLGHIYVDKLTAQDIIKYIDGRGYGPATALQELVILGTVLKVAELVWGYYVPPVMKQARMALKLVGKVDKAKERDRRPTPEEIERLCTWFDLHSTLPMRDIVWFAIHTTMRAEEVVKLRWADYNPADKTILIRDRKDPKNKQGNNQEVPLLDEAIEIIERQPTRDQEHIFPYNHRTFSTIFPRACQLVEPRIIDLRWHDLRHEGTSRLFERGYQIHEVAMFTGHKDWKMLRRYTQLRAKDLRRLLPTSRISPPRQ